MLYLFEYFFNHVAGSAADFHVDPTDIFPHQTQGEDLETNEKKQDRK